MDENSHNDLEQVRREYSLDQLDESILPSDPMVLFGAWMERARQSENPDPTAMTLSTVESNGQPSSRIVLLKKIEADRLVFYTNYHSRKAKEIRSRSRVAAHFYWPELESQVTAWASPQSKVVPDRKYLENEYRKYQEKFKGSKVVPRPAFWGGFAIIPSRMEFWQGGLHRLHDRIEYTLKKKHWSRVRLAP